MVLFFALLIAVREADNAAAIKIEIMTRTIESSIKLNAVLYFFLTITKLKFNYEQTGVET